MSQWGQGFQIPMQSGFNLQFEQQQPQQNSQFLQPQPSQLSGFAPNGFAPQPTGFPTQPQPPINFQQIPQPGSIQAQPTEFIGDNSERLSRPLPPVPSIPIPPVPPLLTQFQSQNQGSGFLGVQQQPNPFLGTFPTLGGSGLSAQPTGFGRMTAQPTGFGGQAGVGQLKPQMTGFVNPKLQIMSSTFMPLNAGGAPQLPLQQNSIQQHNQAQERGSAGQQMPWTLSKAEKKNYDTIFRSWDAQNTGFINGTMENFGQSGLPKDDLARIWTLVDINNRGKLNIAEFHVAMGLIFRRLNGMPIPDQLPQELIPPSVRGLDSSVNFLKNILKNGTRSRSQPDLSGMKHQLASTTQMLDRAAEADATRTAEDEELDREMDDLRYRVKRVQEDLDYVSRGPRTSAKDEERRKLERELLSLMHERVPEVERKIKARDERKEREKRQWTSDRDRDDRSSYAQTRTPSVPKPSSSPAPNKIMTTEERKAFVRAEVQRRMQARMVALGV